MDSMMCTIRALTKDSKNKIVDSLEKGKVSYILTNHIEGDVMLFNLDFCFNNCKLIQKDNIITITICDSGNYPVTVLKIFDSEYLSISIHI